MAGAVGHALLQRRPALVVLFAAEVGVRLVRVLRVVAASVVRAEDTSSAAQTHLRLRSLHASAC
jgi:hypothetical protein